MHTHRSAPRGQTLALGAITMLILALMVFITLNITQSLHAKIKMQNYADAKAYSLAVQEARALNYFAYTNRAIASSYVAMANLHAYMAEAAMLADTDGAAAAIMYEISAQEYDLCFCCWIGPCCFQHCIDGAIADIRGVMFTIGYFSGEYRSPLQGLDGPFRNTMSALDAHSIALNASQIAVRAEVALLLRTGEIAQLKTENVGTAPVDDVVALLPENEVQFNRMFLSDDAMKKKIMAEVINATRPDFTRDRDLGFFQTPIAVSALFAPVTMQRVRQKAGEGTWTVLQPTIPWKAGRTAMSDRAYGMMAFTNREVSPGRVSGNTIASYAYGVLAGQWRHGASASPLPMLGPIDVARISSGQSPGHTAGFLGDLFNRPHSGGNHNSPRFNLSRFMELNIDANAPYRQPAVFAGATGDTRFNERGYRSKVFEVTDSGHISFDVGAAGTGDVQLSNDQEGASVSKALVYYHRIGDWSDYPNLFNPYWRAKLEPMTAAEAARVLPMVDGDAVGLVGVMAGLPNGRGAVNLQ